jgi:hypothetical protein
VYAIDSVPVSDTVSHFCLLEAAGVSAGRPGPLLAVPDAPLTLPVHGMSRIRHGKKFQELSLAGATTPRWLVNINPTAALRVH